MFQNIRKPPRTKPPNSNNFVKCTLENNNKKTTQTFAGEVKIGEIKDILVNKYQQEFKEENFNDKKLEFFCNGHKIKDDDMEIGDVNNGEDVDLIMLSVSMNESISESDKSISKSQKYRERILGKLVTTCNFHNQNKESNILPYFNIILNHCYTLSENMN